MLQITMINNHDSQPSPAAPDTQLPALSPRRLTARRANAQKCTGPRTPEGKATTRLNALKHGGPARAEEFNSLLDALLEDFQPQSARERLLVDEVAACCWRIRRLLRYECRESWVDEDDFRRAAEKETPSEGIAALMGYDHLATRQRTYRKLHSAGLDSLILPSEIDIDKIVRYESLIKRNLYRALYTLESMRAARIRPDASDPTASPSASNEKQF
jgi:hypothetical protein